MFFDNSAKRQRFLEHIISHFCPEAKKKKIKGLCKTRWVERHSTFDTILELYPYLVKTWIEICLPSNAEDLYPDGNDWSWDRETRTAANGLRHTFMNFEHIAPFVCSKEILSPIRPHAESLQGRLNEVYFGFKKINEVTQSYIKLKENIEVEHNRIYLKVKKLAEEIGSKEEMPCIIQGRQTRPI